MFIFALLSILFNGVLEIPMIESDAPEGSFWGYDDCNFYTNGEVLMLEALKPNSVVFDVGANRGTWSSAALKKEPSIHLYSFEPLPEQFQELASHIRSHPERLYNFAFSNEPGKGAFYALTGDASQLSGFFPRPPYTDSATVIEVDLDTIDHFCSAQGISYIDYLKIDTEGGELKVLQGAKNMLLKKNVHALQFEYGGTYSDANITLEEVMHLLTQAGYAIFRISAHGLIHISHWDESLENYRYANYFATPQSEVPEYSLIEEFQ